MEQTVKLYATVFALVALAVTPALAQQAAPPPLPTSYTFTFTPENTDALYSALERASQMQVIVTGDRSSRFDALEQQIKLGVLEQKLAAAKAAEEAAKVAAKAVEPKAEPPHSVPVKP